MFDSNGNSNQNRSYAFITKLVPGLVLGVDSLAIVGVGYLTFRLFAYYSYETINLYWTAITFNWLVTVALLYFGGLYRQDAIFRPISVIDRLILAPVTAFLLLLAAAFSIKQSEMLSRLWGAALLPSCVMALVFARVICALVLRSIAVRRVFSRRMVLAGEGEQLRAFMHYLADTKPNFITLVGVFGPEADAATPSAPFLGSYEALADYTRANPIDDIVLALPWSSDGPITSLIERLRELPANVYLGSDLIGFKINLRPPPAHYEALPLAQVTGKPLTGWDVVLKGLEDYVLGSIILVALSPLLLLAALAIKLDSEGPMLFRQKRLGFNNQAFDIYKFRTMTHRPNDDGPTVQATRNDPRVTRLGRFLRRSSIDELPQLFNVLNGTMSLVGPRPHAIDHNEEYSRKIRGYFSRHRVKPGITGLAQVKGFRGPTESVEKMAMRVKYDVEYADDWSLTLDLKILARTILVCLWGRNAH